MKDMYIYNMDIGVYERDYLINKCDFITIDTETTGLDPLNDKLCLIQIYDGNKTYILKYNNRLVYYNFIDVLQNNLVKKVFHHANFDLRFLMKNLNINDINNVACTKIASKLLNGVEEENSLKYLVSKYLNIDISKDLQVSNWSLDKLSEKQLEYAKNDVVYLYKLWKYIRELLKENSKDDIAQKCFNYLPINSKLHNEGIENIFIY
ncbi:ribonuclease D [Clostridium senegalense]